MKKLLCTITAAAAAILLGSVTAYADTTEPLAENTVEAYAYTAEDQSAQLEYTELEDGTLSISGSSNAFRTAAEDLIIPSTWNGKQVTAISNLGWCKKLKTVTIPDSITSISSGSFTICNALDTISVDPSNNFYSSQDGVLYDKNKQRLVFYPQGRAEEHFTVPDSVTEIGEYAFYGSNNVKFVSFPDSVTRIGNDAFSFCKRLTSLTLPNGITSIEDRTFYYCGITSVVIPDGVTSIGNSAFMQSGINSVVIPDSVTSIGFSAFQWSALASVTLSNGLTSLDSGVFDNCKLTSIRIPDSITSIGDYAFFACESLKSVIIPGSVTNIGAGAFNGCSAIETLIIPNGVTSFGFEAFCGCAALTTVYLPDSVTDFDKRAFACCWALTDVYYEGTESQWENINFGIGNGYVTNANLHFNSVIPDPDEFFAPDEPDDTPKIPVTITIPKPAENAPAINLTATAKTASGEVIELPIDENGDLDISSLANGDYSFTFAADKCAPRSCEVTVSDGTVSGLESGVELHLYGDITGDGVVNIIDVGKANAHAKSGTEITENTLTGYDLTVSDINGDGTVNIQDVAKMNAHFKETLMLW